nr:MAG TPA: hypothetical protein [Caudoviricetes sp.]
MLQTEHRGFSNIRPNALLREAGWISLVLLYHKSRKKKAADPKACRFF